MATNTCPACGQPIAIDDINVQEGIGLCRSCGKLSRLADIADQLDVDTNALETPPAGCWCEEPFGRGLVVRASLRSLGTAGGTLFACLFWNGIVSVFVLLAIAGLYTNLVGPLPRWFPAPTGSVKNGHGNVGPDMPLGTTLFLCIFLIPFVVIGFWLILGFFTCLIGRIEIVVRGDDGRVRTGFGPFNWTRRFDASSVKRIVAGQTWYEQNGMPRPLIQIDADRTVKFGTMLTDERRAWMISVLHLLLVAPSQASQGGRARPSLSPLAPGGLRPAITPRRY